MERLRTATPKELAEMNEEAAELIHEELAKDEPDLKTIEKLCWGIRHRSNGIIRALEALEVKETDNQ